MILTQLRLYYPYANSYVTYTEYFPSVFGEVLKDAAEMWAVVLTPEIPFNEKSIRLFSLRVPTQHVYLNE